MAADSVGAERNEDKAASPTAHCRWQALSVSGGLRHASVERVLRRLLPDLCAALPRKNGGGMLELSLEVAADGTVREVRVRSRSDLESKLPERLRERLIGLDFGPVPGGAPVRIEVELVYPG